MYCTTKPQLEMVHKDDLRFVPFRFYKNNPLQSKKKYMYTSKDYSLKNWTGIAFSCMTESRAMCQRDINQVIV
jgi:hypothetical protein